MLTLNEYLEKASKRLPEEAPRVLKVLNSEGPMNKEGLSLHAQVKRAVLDHILMQLYALGLVEVETEGKSKICYPTQLANDFLEIIQEKEEAS